MDDDKKNGAGSDKAGENKDEKGKEGEENKDGKDGEENFDYSKELSRIQERNSSKYSPLEKAKYAASKIAEEIAKLGGDPHEIFSTKKEDGEDKGKDGKFKIESAEQLAEIVSKIVNKEVGNVRSTFAKAEVETRITKLTKSAEEKSLVQYHFDHTIVQTGDLDEDVENAYIIANKHRTKQIFEALVGKKGAEDGKSDGTGDGQKRQETTRPKVSAQEESFAKTRGLVWSDEDGRYVSPARQKHLEKAKK